MSCALGAALPVQADAVCSTSETVELAQAKMPETMVIVDLQPLYEDFCRECRAAYLHASGNDTAGADDSAAAWAAEKMPVSLAFSRDGSKLSSEFPFQKHCAILLSQPGGDHFYRLRFTLQDGRGKYYGYANFPNCQVRSGRVFTITADGKNFKSWQWSRQVVFKPSSKLLRQYPALTKGGVALWEGRSYKLDKNGCFTATCAFREPDTFEITYKVGTKALEVVMDNAAVTPATAQIVVDSQYVRK